jgi:hypothetical protein
MNRWRVGEDTGSKETDGCPLTEVAAYWRERWLVSSVSDVRIMWNITSPMYLNNNHPWSLV